MTKYVIYGARTKRCIGYVETEEQAQAYVQKAHALHEQLRNWQRNRDKSVNEYLAERDIKYPAPYNFDKVAFLHQKEMFNKTVEHARALFRVSNPQPILPKYLLDTARYAYQAIEELH